jgi:SAM-dependent methyltransferase
VLPDPQQERELIKALEILTVSKNYNKWLVSHFLHYLQGVVLEVGSGMGTLAGYFDRPEVKEIILSDYSPEMVRRLSERFSADSKYRAQQIDVLAMSEGGIGGIGLVDRVISINMLEHVEDDILAFKNMVSVLKPGGMLLLMAPALPWIHGTLDDMAGHSRRYYREDLIRFALQEELHPIQAYYVNILGVLTWFLAGKVFRSKAFSAPACRILDKVVPVLSFL